MKRAVLIIALITGLSFAISGCSGTAGTLVIVAFGGSTTAPHTVDGNTLETYTASLKKKLLERNIEASIINSGVSGNTTVDGRDRFKKDILDLKPDIVIIQFGLNDSIIDASRGKREPRVAQDVFEENLTYFVEELKAEGSKVILMTSNPMRWTIDLVNIFMGAYDFHDRWGMNIHNSEYAESVRRIADEQKVALIDIYQHYLDYDVEEGQSADDLLLDGIHPNAKAHAMVADLLAAEIKKR